MHLDVSTIAQLVIAISLALLSLGSLTIVAKIAWGARGVFEAQQRHQEDVQRSQQEVLSQLSKSVGTQTDMLKIVQEMKEERGQISISYGVLSEKYEAMSERLDQISKQMTLWGDSKR